jgi:hypothetical protein
MTAGSPLPKEYARGFGLLLSADGTISKWPILEVSEICGRAFRLMIGTVCFSFLLETLAIGRVKRDLPRVQVVLFLRFVGLLDFPKLRLNNPKT